MRKSNANNPVIITQPISIGLNELRNGDVQVNNNPSVIIVNSSVVQAPLGNDLLGRLAKANRVIIKPKKELLEVMFGCEVENRYDIWNEDNQLIYIAEEKTDYCMRFWMGSRRTLSLNIKEPESGDPVMFLERPVPFSRGNLLCMQSMNISSPPEVNIGGIQQRGRCPSELHILDDHGQIEFIVECPWPVSCCGDVTFPVFEADGHTVCGRISKNWKGIIGKTLTDDDDAALIFGVQFPPGAGPSSKVLLLGAAFLLYYMYFEEKGHGPPLSLQAFTGKF